MKNQGLIIPIIICIALFCQMVSCTGNRGNDIPDCEITAPLDSLMATIFPSPDEPGGVMMVCRGDSIVYKRCFGMADLERDIPMSDSVVFNISSASKTFAAVSIAKLRDEGRLSFDDSLSRFFPDFPKDIFNKVKLKYILNHTSGLPDRRPRNADEWSEYVKQHPSPFGYGPDYMLYGREDELISFFRTLDSLKSEPGTTFEFQNAPYMLIPYVLENVTGRTFESWMRDNIFTPIGLKDTEYYDPAREHPRMAHAYTRAKDDSKGSWTQLDYGETEYFITRGDHGVCTTPTEFMKWLNALYDGKVVSMSTLRELGTPSSPVVDDSIGLYYGLGAYIQDIETKPYKLLHSRNNGGFSIYDAVFPYQDVKYFILSNRPDWDRRMVGRSIDSILVANKWLVPQRDLKKSRHIEN